MKFKTKYVIVRREPHGEAVDTYIMACADNPADAEEFILALAEEYSYTAFCGSIYLENSDIKTAFEVADEAEDYYIKSCLIFPVAEV